MQHACRSMSLTLDRGLTTPSGRVHSLRGANRPGPCGVPSSLRQICSRSRCASMPRQSDRAATARFKPRFMVLSSNRTTPQVDQATHTEASGDFPQLRAAGREETAQQPIPSKLLDPRSISSGRHHSPAARNKGGGGGGGGTANSLPFRIFGSPCRENQTIFWPLSLVAVMRH